MWQREVLHPGRQPLRAGRVPASPERNAGIPISGRLCLISCLPGRPEPAPLAGPPVPKEPRPAPPTPGTRARRGPRAGAAGAPAHLPPARLRPRGRARLLPPCWKNPRPAWNFLQGPLAEAMRGGEGRGTGARPRPEAPVLQPCQEARPAKGDRPSPSSVLPEAEEPQARLAPLERERVPQ